MPAAPTTNTRIGPIATDVLLDQITLQRFAVIRQDGPAMPIRPIQTLLDGDTLFALWTGAIEGRVSTDGQVRLGPIAVDVVSRASARTLVEAACLGDRGTAPAGERRWQAEMASRGRSEALGNDVRRAGRAAFPVRTYPVDGRSIRRGSPLRTMRCHNN